MRNSWLPILIGLLAMWPAVSRAAQDASTPEPKLGYSLGHGVVTEGRTVTLDALPEYSAADRKHAQEAEEREFMPVSPAQYAALKKAARLPRASGTTIEPSPIPQGNIGDTPGTQLAFTGGDEGACGGFIPSDHAIASSQFYLIQVLNSCILVKNPKTGATVKGYPKSLISFFGAPAGHNVGDIRAIFDSFTNRFIVVAEDFSANTYYVAATATGNPLGSWFIYNLGTQGSNCGDFPMVGLHHQENGDNQGALYLSFDEFNCNSGAFVDDKVFALPLTPIYKGAGFNFSFFFNLNFGGVTVDHVQPANTQAAGDRSRVEYLINTRDFNFGGGVCSTGCNGLDVWAIYNGVPGSGQTPALTGTHIGTANNYFLPADAHQSGESSCQVLLDTGFASITQMVPYAGGSLYATAETDSSVGTPAFLFWEVKPFVNDSGFVTTATILNEICWGCGGFGNDTAGEFYPAVQPDSEGNLLTVFNYSDVSLFPSAAYLMQHSSQGTGVFHDGGVFLMSGAANYCQIDFADGKNRWGDYTATSLVVTPHPEFWFGAQFSETNGNWGTAMGKAGYTDVSTP